MWDTIAANFEAAGAPTTLVAELRTGRISPSQVRTLSRSQIGIAGRWNGVATREQAGAIRLALGR